MRISDWSSDVCSSDLPLRNMAYQSVTMFRATRRLAFRGPADMRRAMTERPPSATDVLIVGAGIAGARLAAALAPSRRRSAERRVGKEGVRTGRSRWSPFHLKKNY